MSAARVPVVPGGASALRPPPERVPLPPAPNHSAAPAPQNIPAAAPVAPVSSPAPDVPPPPPAATRHSREQLNTKIRIDLRARLNTFVEQHNSTLQGVLEAALDEYMTRRGWSWDDYQHAERRR